MDKLFVRVTEWVKDKDPNRVVDIASKERCLCCTLKTIPDELRDMWVFTEQVALMKEALYATSEFRQQHQSSEMIWLVDLQPEITAMDLALIFSRWRGKEANSIALEELMKVFAINGMNVIPHTALDDETIEWVNYKADDLYALVDAAIKARLNK